MDFIAELSQDLCEHGNETWVLWNFLIIWVTISFSS